MTTTADPLRLPGVEFHERWIGVDDGVELRVLRWTGESTAARRPVIFVAGLVSIVEGWLPVLAEMAAIRPVHYIETREKTTARIDASRMEISGFTVPRFGADLVAAVRGLGLDFGHCLCFGSSLGSNTILEALKTAEPCAGAFLIGPNIEFAFPWWGRLMIRLPAASFAVLKHVVLWYLRHVLVNTAEDPAQMQRYDTTIRLANPRRVKLLAHALVPYSIWPALDRIEAPVVLAYAANDTLHGEAEVGSIVEALPHARGLVCENNTFMHQAPIAAEFEAFVRDLDGRWGSRLNPRT